MLGSGRQESPALADFHWGFKWAVGRMTRPTQYSASLFLQRGKRQRHSKRRSMSPIRDHRWSIFYSHKRDCPEGATRGHLAPTAGGCGVESSKKKKQQFIPNRCPEASDTYFTLTA
ncbi:hypothetical protein EYF80_029102 [Liparis tanakae]|uniref:Uncharacterized protein n=1 Tax=Liparis tanakae TaxID=230148 RepID=A0A4Z2H4E4_9TELE|nr:hypothetical protein EYF80_029102 [Liparis tanakae]